MSLFIERTKSQVLEKIESGEHLPLSVWSTRGWPGDLIEQKCEDFVVHPVLGIKLYKVVTLTVANKKAEGTTQGQRISGLSGGPLLKAKAKAKSAG